MAQQEIAIQDLPQSFQPPVPALDRMARLCALAVLLIGLVVLAGWALNIEVLKSMLPGLTSMKPNTALSLVLAGSALALRQRGGLRLTCAAVIDVRSSTTPARWRRVKPARNRRRTAWPKSPRPSAAAASRSN